MFLAPQSRRLPAPKELKLWLSNRSSPWKTRCQRALVWTTGTTDGRRKSRFTRNGTWGNCGFSWAWKNGHDLEGEGRGRHLRQMGGSREGRRGRRPARLAYRVSSRWGWTSISHTEKRGPGAVPGHVHGVVHRGALLVFIRVEALWMHHVSSCFVETTLLISFLRNGFVLK